MNIVSAEQTIPAPPPSWSSIEVPVGRGQAENSDPARRFTLSLTPDLEGDPEPAKITSETPVKLDGPVSNAVSNAAAQAELAAVAAFLIDTSYRLVPIFTVARMIGCFFLAEHAPEELGAVTVSLKGSDGTWAMARVNRNKIAAETTGFGRAIILHEDSVLGLYVLEIAPGNAIPAHAHKVMRERELILDDGLLQQAQPVRRGLAFDWPLGHVHAYENPTERPLRVLCADAPRFLPDDEVALDDPPPLEPIAPFGDYAA
ncbi:MAG: hypothetical protein OEN23_02255 [Paracoccaceae bacterium]|nr:hypothetical protein [Paracoccaceae bacterium]